MELFYLICIVVFTGLSTQEAIAAGNKLKGFYALPERVEINYDKYANELEEVRELMKNKRYEDSLATAESIIQDLDEFLISYDSIDLATVLANAMYNKIQLLKRLDRPIEVMIESEILKQFPYPLDQRVWEQSPLSPRSVADLIIIRLKAELPTLDDFDVLNVDKTSNAATIELGYKRLKHYLMHVKTNQHKDIQQAVEDMLQLVEDSYDNLSER